MNEREKDNSIKQQFADVVSRLDRLAEAVDAHRYPGIAWTAPPVKARRVARAWGAWRYRLLWPAVAAAVVLMAMGALWLFSPRDGVQAPPSPPSVVEDAVVWTMPEVDPSLAALLPMEIPQVSMTAEDPEAGGLEWTTPSLSFPTFDEMMEVEDEPADLPKQSKTPSTG